jgi:hypothetical protein
VRPPDIDTDRVTPHIVQKERSAVDGRTTRHAGYPISQRVRKRVEEGFGWMKTIGLLRKLRHRGLQRVGWIFTLRRRHTIWSVREI